MDTITSVEDHIIEHLKESTGRAVAKDRFALWNRDCPEFTNQAFMRAGVIRALNRSESGRDYLQFSEEVLDIKIPLTTYFKALRSRRRRDMLKAVEEQSYQINADYISSLAVDYLEDYPELEGYLVEASDGHFIDHACHTEKNDKGKIFAAGFIYSLNLRNGLIRPFCRVTNGTEKSHESPVFRRIMDEAKSCNQKQKRISIYDKALTNYRWWESRKRHNHYVVSLLKDNAVVDDNGTDIDYGKDKKINTGVVSYKRYRKGLNTFSVVEYKDPETGEAHVFMTTLSEKVNPGTIAMLYYKRWTIEKAFNNYKSDMKEKKAWSPENAALDMQMMFIAMAYNLFRTAEEKALDSEPELVSPSENKYKKTLDKRNIEAQGKGAYVNPMHYCKRIARIASSTVRSFQNAISRGRSYEWLLNRIIQKLVPPLPITGEH